MLTIQKKRIEPTKTMPSFHFLFDVSFFVEDLWLECMPRDALNRPLGQHLSPHSILHVQGLPSGPMVKTPEKEWTEDNKKPFRSIIPGY